MLTGGVDCKKFKSLTFLLCNLMQELFLPKAIESQILLYTDSSKKKKKKPIICPVVEAGGIASVLFIIKAAQPITIIQALSIPAFPPILSEYLDSILIPLNLVAVSIRARTPQFHLGLTEGPISYPLHGELLHSSLLGDLKQNVWLTFFAFL